MHINLTLEKHENFPIIVLRQSYSTPCWQFAFCVWYSKSPLLAVPLACRLEEFTKSAQNHAQSGPCGAPMKARPTQIARAASNGRMLEIAAGRRGRASEECVPRGDPGNECESVANSTATITQSKVPLGKRDLLRSGGSWAKCQ